MSASIADEIVELYEPLAEELGASLEVRGAEGPRRARQSRAPRSGARQSRRQRTEIWGRRRMRGSVSVTARRVGADDRARRRRSGARRRAAGSREGARALRAPGGVAVAAGFGLWGSPWRWRSPGCIRAVCAWRTMSRACAWSSRSRGCARRLQPTRLRTGRERGAARQAGAAPALPPRCDCRQHTPRALRLVARRKRDQPGV